MNLEDEIRDGYLISSQMKKIWQVQMDLATQLIDVCKKHNLRIWATAGTLLGVIRHHGYIPWDDDMDFVMLREDYDKLLSFAGEFRHPYFLQSAMNEPGYSRGHAQLRNSNTSAILPADVWQSFNQGIFIDIFVFDDMTDDTESWPDKIENIQARLSKMRYRTYRSFGTKDLGSIWRLLKSVFRFNRRTLKQYYVDTEDIVRNWEKGDKAFLTNVMFAPRPYRRLCRDWYAKTIWLPFEDMQMPVPYEYDKELKAYYGDDYMTPKMSSSMHGTVVFDVNIPYKQKLKELRRKLNLKERIRGYLVPGI